MSGEADGIILLPLVALTLPYIWPVLVGGAVIAGAGAAISVVADIEADRQRNKRNRRAEIQRSGLNESIGSFRNVLANNMNEQAELNRRVSAQMMEEMDKNRQELTRLINENDPEKFKRYMSQVKTSRKNLTDKLTGMQEEFVKNYHTKINESMNTVTMEINRQFSTYMEELAALKESQQAKQQKAAEIADNYLKEAKTLVAAFENEYEAQKYAKLSLMDLQKTLNDAVALYNNGNYESAIATAKSVAIDTIEEIYKADCKKQEWDGYYNLALSLAAELETFMTAQKTITAEVKSEAEKRTGKQLEDEVVGIDVSEYTAKRADGTSEYEFLLSKTREIKTLLLSENANALTTMQVKHYAEMLNSDLFPAAQLSIYKGILNMSNAFSRQNISEEIIDFFEEHNFNFTGYNYDNDQHDGALHIGLENDVTGEEIIVTLAPELMSNGEVQTKVEIDQLKGDETNEARKEYYRQSVRQVVLDNTPGAQIKLECKKETHNKLSQKTELRDKLQA